MKFGLGPALLALSACALASANISLTNNQFSGGVGVSFSSDCSSDSCSNVDSMLKLEKVYDHVAFHKTSDLAYKGYRGIDFSEDGNTAFITAGDLLILDLNTGAREYVGIHAPTGNDGFQVHIIDDVVRVGGDLYMTSVFDVMTFPANGGAGSSRGYIIKMNIASREQSVFWASEVGEMWVNPIAYADGHLYVASALGYKNEMAGIVGVPNATITDPEYPRKLWKISVATGQTAWQKEYPVYLNAFTVRDGYLYAGSSTYGGHRATNAPGTSADTYPAYQGEQFELVRVNTDTGVMEPVIAYPFMPMNAYITAVKSRGNKMFIQTDRMWVVDYDEVNKRVVPESMRTAYDFGKLEPAGIRVRSLAMYLNNNDATPQEPQVGRYQQSVAYTLDEVRQVTVILDNGEFSVDGKYYYLSGDSMLFKFKIQSEGSVPAYETVV